MSRRRTGIQANSGIEGVSTPGTSKNPQRRLSLRSTASLRASQLKPSTLMNSQKKLTESDIHNDLINSNNSLSDEDEQFKSEKKGKPKIYECSRVGDHESIALKIKLIDAGIITNNFEYKIGLKKKPKTPEKRKQCKSVGPERKSRKSTFATEQTGKSCTALTDSYEKVKNNRGTSKTNENLVENSEKRILRTMSPKNLNENHLFNRALNQTPKSSRNSIKLTDAKTTPRKRTAPSSYQNAKESYAVSDNNEVDENLMRNANKTAKRSKSINDIKLKLARTPVISLETLDSPSKNLKKMNLNFPSTPKSGATSRKIFKSKELTTKSSYQVKTDSDEEENAKGISDFEESGDDSDVSFIALSSSTDSDDDTSGDDEEFCKKRKKIPKTPSKTSKKVSMETPTKSMARMSLTPAMHQRTINIVKPSTPLQEARLKLHVSVLPKSLPCREEQFNDIYTFLHARLSDKSGGCIYISGVPGTGKTATVNEVIRCLKKSMDAGKLTKFEFVDINGMKLSEPRQAYVQILKQLTGQQTTWEEAQKLLQQRFNKSNSSRGMTLLLVDELDLLCTKRQDVVYNLLDWPTKTGAKLVVVTIANTMDLPERVFMGKVTSRLGLSRLTFPPYNYKQLEEIVVSRLRGYNAFGGETIQLVARKVAAVSGDARRALDICRRATEVAENNNRDIVSMIDVKRAVDEMIASPKIQAIKHCSEMERIFLQAVCAEVHRTGVEEVVFQNVYMQLSPLCTLNGETTPNVTEALSMCARLGAWRLLLCEHSRMDIHQRILLNVSTDDVQFAIKAIEV